MRKTLLIGLFTGVCLMASASLGLADPDPYALMQKTYLLQKEDQGADPWILVLPDEEPRDVAFGKFEYQNFSTGEGFCFDFKGYDFGGVDEDGNTSGDPFMPIPVDDEYALVYYVDPGIGWPSGPPDVLVLGFSSGAYERPEKAKGKAKGLEGVDFKIGGCCDILQIPELDDVNYPNGGKIWLVPTATLAPFEEGGGLAECAWAKMVGWPQGGQGILFETSLITYGFAPEQEQPEEEEP